MVALLASLAISVATAQNTSQTWQAIFQVQQGCQSHCQGTSQSQTAGQTAETIQNANAIGGGTGSPSNATALNQSTTGQFIWQVQLGCVAFCYGTSQSQTSSVRVEPLSGLGESNFGFGTISWLLIGLLMAFGIAILRKTQLRSPAV